MQKWNKRFIESNKIKDYNDTLNLQQRSDRMDGVEKFGQMLSDYAVSSPEKARKMLSLACQIQQLSQILPNKNVSRSRQYGAKIVANVLQKSMDHPEKTAMVSIFVPCEPLVTAGIVPFSVEALSGFATGTHCEQVFLKKTEEEGEPQTLCSFHRVLHGAMDMGVFPAPPMLIYTNLACDANMIGFPYMTEKYKIPSFFIEVPFERNDESVYYVADQLKEMVKFIEDISKKEITFEALKESVQRGQQTAHYYLESQKYQKDHTLRGPIESEMYGIYSGHIMLGSKEAELYNKKMLEEIRTSKNDDEAVRLIWMHMIPYTLPSMVNNINIPGKCRIVGNDLVYDCMMEVDSDDPYYVMAYRMVHSTYNGDYMNRARKTIEMAKLTNAEGIVLFEHWGCKATFGAAHLFEKAFAKEGFPTLFINGDGADSSNCNDGQMATRLEAFIEMLKEKRND